VKHETKYKLRIGIASAAVAVIGVGSAALVGKISQLQAFDLLKTILPTTRFFCSALMTGTSTILALMVTLVSLSRSSPAELSDEHYRRIQRLAMLDSMAFVGALLLLLFVMIPMEDAEVLPGGWYRVIYYTVMGVSAVLGGLVVSVVMMLYSETKQLIRIIGLDKESPLAENEPDDEQSGSSESNEGNAD